MSTVTADPNGALRAASLAGAWRRFLLRRAGGLAVNLVLLLLVTFLIVQLIPGDPAVAIAGESATLAQVELRGRSSGWTSRSRCSSGPTSPASRRATSGTPTATGCPRSTSWPRRCPSH
ncbi:hypothetical protein [Promicromonospora soli]